MTQSYRYSTQNAINWALLSVGKIPICLYYVLSAKLYWRWVLFTSIKQISTREITKFSVCGIYMRQRKPL